MFGGWDRQLRFMDFPSAHIYIRLDCATNRTCAQQHYTVIQRKKELCPNFHITGDENNAMRGSEINQISQSELRGWCSDMKYIDICTTQ